MKWSTSRRTSWLFANLKAYGELIAKFYAFLLKIGRISSLRIQIIKLGMALDRVRDRAARQGLKIKMDPRKFTGVHK